MTSQGLQPGRRVLVDFEGVTVEGQHRFFLGMYPNQSAVPARIIDVGADGRIRVLVGQGSAQQRFEERVPADRVRLA